MLLKKKKMVGTSSSRSNNINNDLFVDEFYFSALHDNDEIFPISDELYAEELQLQEALISSAISSRINIKNESTEMEETFRGKEKDISESSRRKTLKGKEKEDEISEIFCFICMDAKSKEEMFRNSNCSHSFCTDCTANYVASKIQENISMVKCPELKCKANLEPQFCRHIIPKEVYDRWEEALSQSLVLGSQKFYCPFNDCSAMLVDDGGQIVTASECPNCHRLFCAQCKVSWHAGINCSEFKKLRKGKRKREDILLVELAKNKKWMRCPKCKFYVEKVHGCLHISCRCGIQFCYKCGSTWSEDHLC